MAAGEDTLEDICNSAIVTSYQWNWKQFGSLSSRSRMYTYMDVDRFEFPTRCGVHNDVTFAQVAAESNQCLASKNQGGFKVSYV